MCVLNRRSPAAGPPFCDMREITAAEASLTDRLTLSEKIMTMKLGAPPV